MGVADAETMATARGTMAKPQHCRRIENRRLKQEHMAAARRSRRHDVADPEKIKCRVDDGQGKDRRSQEGTASHRSLVYTPDSAEGRIVLDSKGCAGKWRLRPRLAGVAEQVCQCSAERADRDADHHGGHEESHQRTEHTACFGPCSNARPGDPGKRSTSHTAKSECESHQQVPQSGLRKAGWIH